MALIDNALRFGSKKQKRKGDRHAQTAAASASRWPCEPASDRIDPDRSDVYSDKENDDDTQFLIQKEKQRGDKFQRLLYNANKRVKTWHQKSEKQADMLKGQEKMIKERDKTITHLNGEISWLKEKKEMLAEDKHRYQKENHALKAKVKRIPQRLQTVLKRAAKMFGVQKSFKLKDRGVISDTARDIICDLVALDNVPAKKVVQAFKRIASALGVPVEGDASERSVNRIMKEGGNASKIKIVEAVQTAKGVTISGDGTSHKNNNYESHCATVIDENNEKQQFFLGIKMAVNHTSETQLNGWIELVEELYELYRDSHFCEGEADARNFWTAVTGMHTDHAEDQKKLFRLLKEWKQQCEREKRGEKTVLAMNSLELLSFLFKVSQEAIQEAGGIQEWEKLSELDRKGKHEEMYDRLVREIGQAEFNKLSDAEKADVDFLLWAGCCMHKEMNAFKGGVQAMEQFWIDHGLDGPVKMYNRDNAAASDLAPGTSAAKRADDNSRGGAIKVSSLAGAVFRHKDRKRGQQDTLRFFFDHELGFTICFPDTNNTRFQSHAEACTVIITYLDLLLKFLGYVKDNKASRSLNHMENNVFEGIRCMQTRHEFCAVTMYHQAISVPYMREIRGPYRANDNVLRLGPLHEKVITHLGRIIATPELPIGPEVSHTTGSLDGKLWDRPDAVYAVQRYAPELPHLKDLLSRLCQGALETWRRFAAEFSDDGAIAKASEEDIERAWMESTNDANESAFGIMRQTLRANPSMSIPQFNARKMYKLNETATFQQKMTPEQRKALRKITRRQDESGDNRKEKLEQAKHMQKVSEEKTKKDKARDEKARLAAEAIAKVTVILDLTVLEQAFNLPSRAPGYLKVSDIDLQLDWHLQYDSANTIPKAKSARGTRDNKFRFLKDAVARYNSSISSQGDPSNTTRSPLVETESGNSLGQTIDIDDGEDSKAEYYGNR